MRRGSKQPRYSLEEFIEACDEKHQNKYDYSKTVYTGSRDKITIICPIHGEFEQIAANHKAGRGCPKCYNKNRRAKSLLKSTEDFIKDAKIVHGDKYDYSKVNYINSHSYITIICPEHGEFKQLPYNHLNGRGCSICGQIYSQTIKVSEGEAELKKYISSIYKGKIIYSCRSIITPLELDIYIPELNLAFEYNGIYWHSEQMGKDKNYHLNKTNKCLEQGIRLIHIFEDEWLSKTDLIKSKIRHLLNLDTVKIPARKCECCSISNDSAKDFLEKYHIQGNVFSSVNLGLFYDNEIIAVMTFNKPRFNAAYDWELIRYAVKSDISLPGGASKLLKSFRENYNGSIISYADKRWSLGNLYNILGFKELEDSPPNYFYVKPGSIYRESRYKFQKHLLKDRLEVFDPNLSEFDNMKNNGYTRVWDCGNKVYVLD